MLHQIREFIAGVRQELVIVNLSHFRQFGDAQHASLIRLIMDTLGDFLYKKANDHLLTTTIGDFVADGPRVLLVYRDSHAAGRWADGIWPDLSLYDCYADTPDAAAMVKDQTQKMQAHAGNQDQLFLLSWTLTPDTKTLIGDILERIKPWGGHPKSLHDLSQNANQLLAGFVREYARQYQLNVLYVDFYAEAGVTDLAIRANGA